MDVPDISNIPVSVEQYTNEVQKLTWEQLQHISHTQILDNDQHKFMGLHYKMNHLPHLAMITLAGKGKLNRNLPNSNTAFRFACLASLAWLIANHGTQKGKKVWLESMITMLLANVLASNKQSLLNQVWYLKWLAFSQISGFGLQLFFLIITWTMFMSHLCTISHWTSFKQHVNKGGVTINSYQTDNGRFADSGFHQAVKDCNQKITYCAVRAHHQKGIIEQRIKELTLIS